MTHDAIEEAAINLAQGFPHFPAPDVLKDAACTAIQGDVNQYAITWGTPRNPPGPRLEVPHALRVGRGPGGFGPHAAICEAQSVFVAIDPPRDRLEPDRLAAAVSDRTRAKRVVDQAYDPDREASPDRPREDLDELTELGSRAAT